MRVYSQDAVGWSPGKEWARVGREGNLIGGSVRDRGKLTFEVKQEMCINPVLRIHHKTRNLQREKMTMAKQTCRASPLLA